MLLKYIWDIYGFNRLTIDINLKKDLLYLKLIWDIYDANRLTMDINKIDSQCIWNMSEISMVLTG